MKFKNYLILFMSISLLFSCNENEDLDSESAWGEKELINDLTVQDYLNERYNRSYSVVETVTRVVEEVELTIAKVSVNDNDIDVYVAYDATSNVIKYFTEFDWNRSIAENVDFELDEIESFYVDETVEDDGGFFYDSRAAALEDIVGESSPVVDRDKPKFWGWSCGKVWNLTSDQNPTPVRNCCYRVLGRVTECDVYNDGSLPGKNPKILTDRISG